jgi:hypothetical protein
MRRYWAAYSPVEQWLLGLAGCLLAVVSVMAVTRWEYRFAWIFGAVIAGIGILISISHWLRQNQTEQ